MNKSPRALLTGLRLENNETSYQATKSRSNIRQKRSIEFWITIYPRVNLIAKTTDYDRYNGKCIPAIEKFTFETNILLMAFQFDYNST